MPGPGLLIYIDKLLSIPYQVLIRWFIKIRSGRPTRAKDTVIIIKMMGIGSITRIYATLKQQNVDFSKVHLVTLYSNKDLCEVLDIKNIYFVRDKNLFTLSWDLLKLSRRIRLVSPSCLINYERGSNILGLFQIVTTFFTWIKTTSFHDFKEDIISDSDAVYSIHGQSFQQLINKTLPCYEQLIQPSVASMELVVSTKKVLVNINASDYMPYRKYPVEYYATIIKALHQWDSALSFDLIGNAAESRYVNKLMRRIRDLDTVINNRCGEWSLSDLVTNLSDCALLITNDSGPMHLGAFVNAPMVTIWGPTSYQLFGYESPQISNIQTDMPCSPCFIYAKSKAAKMCNKRIDCMQSISTDEIIKAAKEKLTNPDLFRVVELSQVKSRVNQSIYDLVT